MAMENGDLMSIEPAVGFGTGPGKCAECKLEPDAVASPTFH